MAVDWTFGGTWRFEPRWFESQDGRMHYVDEGPRDGRPVVLLHGNPTWGYLYRHFVGPLVDAGHRAIVPDHLGFGRSDKPDRAELYTIRRHAERLDALLESLDLHDATVVPQDWGGPIGLWWATRHPDRVSGLILLSAFGWYPSLATWSGHFGLLLWRILGNGIANCILRASRPLGVPGALGFRFTRDVARVYLGPCHLDLAAYRAKCELALRFDARPWLASIACPTFVLVGNWDPVVPASAGRELARLLPNARLHRLPGGHLAHLVHAAEAGRLIASWAAEQAGRAPGPAAPPDRAGPAPRAPG
jgi:pimeloyl-ACP methyl ester carboxylesterase